MGNWNTGKNSGVAGRAIFVSGSSLRYGELTGLSLDASATYQMDAEHLRIADSAETAGTRP